MLMEIDGLPKYSRADHSVRHTWPPADVYVSVYMKLILYQKNLQAQDKILSSIIDADAVTWNNHEICKK
jgi:hypothetical protein